MSNSSATTHRPVVQPYDRASIKSVLGGSIAVRLCSEQTGGRLGLVEEVIPPGYPGPALHVHPEFDETFYVLEGAIAVRVDDQAHRATAGSVAFVPRGTPHTFANPGDEPARLLVLVNPGGFERYFEAFVDAIDAAGGVPPAPELAELGIAHGSVPA